MQKGFSVVICSYNPDLIVLKRLLNAIDNLRYPDLPVEVILIDNNSQPPLIKYDSVSDFLNNGENRRCLIEPQPGLTAARLRGAEEAIHDWVVFFDDDNESDESYLIYLSEAIEKYPKVFCWGPAQIEVELLNRRENHWVHKKKDLFQQRNWDKTKFGISNLWQHYFPYGTGLSVHKVVLKEYKKRILEGRYNLSDRLGKSLSSGGDLQIVLTATNMGLSAGSVKGMRINHLVISQKSTLQYLRKQVYGTASSYVAAHKQVDESICIPDATASNLEICKELLYFTRLNLFHTTFNEFQLRLAHFLGVFNSRYIYQKNQKKPFIIRFYERLINA